MQDYGSWSLLPPVVAIALALITRQVFISLIVGIWVGWVIIDRGNVLTGSFDTLHAVVDVFSDPGNTRVIIFTLLVGSLIALVQRSGGVEGFTRAVMSWLEKTNHTGKRVRVELLAACTGLVLFIESNISILTVGTLFRPITDKLTVPREKLAYIADSSSAPSCVLIPLNAWGAYLMGLLLGQGVEQPFTVLLKAMVFNFYPLLAIALLFYLILRRKDYGPMLAAEERAAKSGKLLADGATPMISDEIALLTAKENIPLQARDMIIPILGMVILMPVFLMMTGWQDAQGNGQLQRAFSAISNGSGSTSVLFSVTFAILIAMTMYRIKGLMKIPEMVDVSLKGMAGRNRGICCGIKCPVVVAGISASRDLPGQLFYRIFYRYLMGYVCDYDCYCGAGCRRASIVFTVSGGSSDWWWCLWRSLFTHIGYYGDLFDGFCQ